MINLFSTHLIVVSFTVGQSLPLIVTMSIERLLTLSTHKMLVKKKNSHLASTNFTSLKTLLFQRINWTITDKQTNVTLTCTTGYYENPSDITRIILIPWSYIWLKILRVCLPQHAMLFQGHVPHAPQQAAWDEKCVTNNYFRNNFHINS